jgi:hypothetical protein
MDCIHSLPWGLDGWKRRSANTLLIRILLYTQTGKLWTQNQHWDIGGAMLRYHLLCKNTRACNGFTDLSQCQKTSFSVGRSPDNQTALHNTTVPSTWQDELCTQSLVDLSQRQRWAWTQASLIFHNGRNISRIGTQIKLSRFGLLGTQKLYTSHQNIVIYMRTAWLSISLCWCILRVIYTRPYFF